MQQHGRIAGLALMSIAAVLFVWLAVARRSGATLEFDLGVRARVHEWTSPVMTTIARSLTALGSPLFLSVLFGIAILAFYRLDWKRPAITVAEVMAGAVVCNIGLKSLIQRARPEPFFGKEPSSYSFPSGHALYSLCFYGLIASVLAAHAPDRAARIGIWGAAALLIAGIGLSRVYLGVHYPSDVVAGYLSAAFVIGAVFAFSSGWS